MTRLQTLNIPNLHRASIGFDQMFNELERSFANTPNSQGYPPYNIAQINDDEYMISIAVAGFGMDNLEVTQDGNELQIEGKQPVGSEDTNYLHKGIGTRNFKRTFQLAEHVHVENATLELGMLNVHLVRDVPEELKPKSISITQVK